MKGKVTGKEMWELVKSVGENRSRRYFSGLVTLKKLGETIIKIIYRPKPMDQLRDGVKEALGCTRSLTSRRVKDMCRTMR